MDQIEKLQAELEVLEQQREVAYKNWNAIDFKVERLRKKLSAAQPKSTYIVEYGHEGAIKTAEVKCHQWYISGTTVNFYVATAGKNGKENLAAFSNVLSVTLKDSTDSTPA